jgi:hypothetical protein
VEGASGCVVESGHVLVCANLGVCVAPVCRGVCVGGARVCECVDVCACVSALACVCVHSCVFVRECVRV